MDARKHEHEDYDVSIDMEKLADSLSGELESLHPLARESSIYRVPETTRRLHPIDYTPQIVSIGPFHHGNEELIAMEEHKKRYLKCFLQRTKENLLEIQFSKAEHFVDLLMLCLQPSQPSATIALKDRNIPTVKELHQAGVKFKSGSIENLLNIKFNEGILEIPYLTVFDTSERLYRNLLAFERMHGYTRHFSDYIVMMHCLVNSPEDAELLIQNKIIGFGCLGNAEQTLLEDRLARTGDPIANTRTPLLGVKAARGQVSWKLVELGSPLLEQSHEEQGCPQPLSLSWSQQPMAP